jgi:hypothetical protein
MFKRSVYKFVLIDEFGGALRKFASTREAKPFLTDGMTLIKLPTQPTDYELATTLLDEALV